MGRGAEGREGDEQPAPANAADAASSSSSSVPPNQIADANANGGGAAGQTAAAEEVPDGGASTSYTATDAYTDGSSRTTATVGTVGTASLLEVDNDRHAGAVLAYLRQRGLDAAAADVAAWMQGGGGDGDNDNGGIDDNDCLAEEEEEEEEGGRKMPAEIEAGEGQRQVKISSAENNNSDDDDDNNNNNNNNDDDDDNNSNNDEKNNNRREATDESVMGWMSAMSSTVDLSAAGRTMASGDPSGASADNSVGALTGAAGAAAAGTAAAAAAASATTTTTNTNGSGARLSSAASASAASASSSSVKKFFTDFGRSIGLSKRGDGGGGARATGEAGDGNTATGTIGESQHTHSSSGGDGSVGARPTPSVISGFSTGGSRAASSSLPPGAYAVSIAAVSGGRRRGPRRRRRFSGDRYSRASASGGSHHSLSSDDDGNGNDNGDENEDDVDVGTVDTLDRFQRVIDGDDDHDGDDDGTLGRLDRYVDQVLERDAQAERAELRRLSSASDGRIVTVAEATAVEDEIFEASVVDDKDGMMGAAAARWTRRQRALVVGGFLLLVAVIVALSVAAPNSKNGSATTDGVGLGEVCINDDPTVCGCYDQADYRGTINTTVSGHTCLAWGVQDPHENVYVQSERWPMLEANYCRNPDGTPGAWCYTTDPEVRWDYCNVPQCDTSTVPITVSPVAAPVDPPLLDIEAYCDEKAVQPQEATSGIYLDGETAHIALTNTSQADSGINFDGGPLTIEAWIKPELKVNFATILSNREGGSGMSGFLFSVNTWEEQNGKLYFEGTYGQVATTESVQWGKWQHVAVTYDGSNPAFYIDGEQIPFFKQNYYGPFRIDAGYLDAKIGEMGLYHSNSYYKGSIDELKVWDYARSGEEIRSSMHCAGDPNAAGLISYYQFEEADDGMAVYDSGPRGNHGVIVVGEGNEESEDGFIGSESSLGYMYTEGIPLCTLCSGTGITG